MKIDGLPVVDAKRRLPFRITSQDIAKGTNKAPGSCAAAVACVRQTGAIAARVHIGRTYLRMGNKWVRYQTPATLRDEIISFDRGHRFERGTFVLIPLPPSELPGERASRESTEPRSPKGVGKPRTKPKFVQGVRGSAAQYDKRG